MQVLRETTLKVIFVQKHLRRIYLFELIIGAHIEKIKIKVRRI